MPESLPQIHAWHDYYLLAGTAAATLLGLLFIALTLNADLILSGTRPHIKRVAEQAFQNYIAALFTSAIFLLPLPLLRVYPVMLLAENGIMILWSVYRLVRTVRVRDESFGTARLWRRLLPSFISYAMMIDGAFRLLRGYNLDAMMLMAIATLLLVITATGTSWELLVRVAEIRSSGRSAGAGGPRG